MLQDRVKCAVPNPGVVNTGSTIVLGAAPAGFRSFLSAFGGAVPAYFVLTDGAGRALTGIWTVNATTPETATITQILGNDRLGGTVGETFASACAAFNAVPAVEAPTRTWATAQDTATRTWATANLTGGFRNLLINPHFKVNQRGWPSGSAVPAANSFTLDRWRVVVSGQVISWSDTAGVRTVTAPAGGIEQVVEGADLIGGTYTLNWTGTASAAVNSAGVTKGAQITLTGGANVSVVFSGGTVSLPQLERGSVVTPFEMRPRATELMLCQRYFWATSSDIKVGGTMVSGVGAATYVPIWYPVTMRAVPTITPVFASGSGNLSQGLINIGTGNATLLLQANGAYSGGFEVTLNAGCPFVAELP